MTLMLLCAGLIAAASFDLHSRRIPNNQDQTPLHRAVGGSQKDLAEFLISMGADVNSKDDYDFAPIHFSIAKEMFEMLISKGANVNAKTKDNNTPLFSAAANGKNDIVELLIAKGADVNIKNNKGQSPFSYAQGQGLGSTAEILRLHGGK